MPQVFGNDRLSNFEFQPHMEKVLSFQLDLNDLCEKSRGIDKYSEVSTSLPQKQISDINFKSKIDENWHFQLNLKSDLVMDSLI